MQVIVITAALSQSVYADVASRDSYRNADRITTVHEGTHGINSLLRNATPERDNAVYLLGGDFYMIREPRSITLANVAYNVPCELQGMSYRLYMIDQQRYWNREPCILLDELSAYTNGSLCRAQERIRGRQETVLQMVEMLGYCFCMCDLLEQQGELNSDMALAVYYMSLRALDVLRMSPDCRNAYEHWIRLHTNETARRGSAAVTRMVRL